MAEQTVRNLDPEALKARLDPTHLKPDLDKMKKDVEERATPEDEEKEKDKKAADDPRSKTPYTFQFKWEDTRGKQWRGQFTTKVLNAHEERLSGIMQAQLCAGLPYDNLDPYTLEIAFVTAHLAFCLTEKPKWFEKILDRPDGFMVVQAIMREVRSYEDWFRVHGQIEEDGEI